MLKQSMILCSLLGLVCGCGGAQLKHAAHATQDDETGPTTEVTQASQGTQQATACDGPNMVHQGPVQYEGSLGRTKGAQLTINLPDYGMTLLEVSGEIKDQNWVGQTVTVVGDLCIYRCPPRAQCLSTGTLPVLKNVRLTSVQ